MAGSDFDSEVEFGRKVADWLRRQGKCVHGEVCRHFGGQRVYDLVGHAGNCHDPDIESIVVVALKASAGKALRQQVRRVPSGLKVWGACWRAPHESTLEAWIEETSASLLVWGADGLEVAVDRTESDGSPKPQHVPFLVEANRGAKGGYPSGGGPGVVTPHKILRDRALDHLRDLDAGATFTIPELRDRLLADPDPDLQVALDAYDSDPERIVGTVVEALVDDELVDLDTRRGGPSGAHLYRWHGTGDDAEP